MLYFFPQTTLHINIRFKSMMFVGLMIVLAFLSVSVSLDSKISLIIYFLKWNWKIIWVWWRLQCYFCLLVDNMTWQANLDRKINIKRYTCVCVWFTRLLSSGWTGVTVLTAIWESTVTQQFSFLLSCPTV